MAKKYKFNKIKPYKPRKNAKKAFSEIVKAKNLPAPGDIQSTLNERGKTHGNFFVQGAMAQDLKGIVRAHLLLAGDRTLKPCQMEALDMIFGKISRIVHGNPDEPDHWKDIAGYATLIENILVHGKSHLG